MNNFSQVNLCIPKIEIVYMEKTGVSGEGQEDLETYLEGKL